LAQTLTDQDWRLMRDQNEVSSGAPRETPVIVTVVFAALTVSLLAVVWLIVPLHGARGSALLGSSIFFADDLLNLSILEWGSKAILGADKTVFGWPIGHPVRESLASTESLLGWQWLYLPLRAAGVS
jgi:hypothetical protein